MKSKPITVALVEDVAGTRESLKAILSRAGGLQCVAACESGEQALKALPALAPDVVLMDINLPGMSGIECVSKLKQELPATQVLILTTYQDSDLIFDSLRAGASGYLLKNSTPSEITQAIEHVQGGGSPMSVHIARKVVNYFQERDRQSQSELAHLTAREQQVLALLAKGYLYKEIADQMGVTLHTVRAHLHTVYEKLHVQSRTEAVVKFLQR
jgi:DNA-binding NarL/FixJ family response regulator